MSSAKRRGESKVRLAESPSPKGLAFIVMEIGEEGTNARKRADDVYTYIIQEALAQVGYEALRADQIAKSGQITNDIVEHLVQDPLVIADITGGNPNVFYELALRHVTRKPYVMLAKRGERLPFDIFQTRTIFFDETDLASVDDCKKQLVATVESLQNPDTEVENPIALVLDRISIKTAVGQTEQYLRGILTQLLSFSSKLTLGYVGTLPPFSAVDMISIESRLDSITSKMRQLNIDFSYIGGGSGLMFLESRLDHIESKLDGMLKKIREIGLFDLRDH